MVAYEILKGPAFACSLITLTWDVFRWVLNTLMALQWSGSELKMLWWSWTVWVACKKCFRIVGTTKISWIYHYIWSRYLQLVLHNMSEGLTRHAARGPITDSINKWRYWSLWNSSKQMYWRGICLNPMHLFIWVQVGCYNNTPHLPLNRLSWLRVSYRELRFGIPIFKDGYEYQPLTYNVAKTVLWYQLS